MSYSDLPKLRSNVASAAASLKPAVAVGAGAGSGATVSVVGTDEAGTITLVTAGTPATGTLVTLTFATPYANVVPSSVSVDAGDPISAGAALYASVTGTTLTISAHVAPTVGTLKIFYSVIGGA